MAHEPYAAPASDPTEPTLALDPTVVADLPWRGRTPPRARLACAVALPGLLLLACAGAGWSQAVALTPAQTGLARSATILLAPPIAI
ncbi:MAG: hypothetical protein AAGC67_22850, partial [Myxococcota bacterium]